MAVESTIEGRPLRLELNAVKGFRKAEIEKLSRRTLVPGTTVISDALGCKSIRPTRQFRNISTVGRMTRPGHGSIMPW